MRPRMEGGETSDTYMGESSETPPTAMPPRNRAQMKSVKLGASAVATEVSANSDSNPHQHALAAEAIGEAAGGKRAQHAAEEQRAEGPSQADVAEREMPRQKRARAGDDGDIKSEKQAAECSSTREKDYVRRFRK